MTKQNKQEKQIEAVENRVDDVVEVARETATQASENQIDEKQADKKHENFAEKSLNETASSQPIPAEKVKGSKQSKGGVALALLALLVAIGVGGVGHYFANSKFASLEAQLKTLANNTASAPATAVELPNFDAEKAQLAQLSAQYQNAVERIKQLENEQNGYTQQIKSLQTQVQKLGLTPAAESATWLFSEADFLLNNALRKVVLDNDINTAKSLLIEADNVLSQISDPKVLAVREAVKNDLAQLSGVNLVDQYSLMQRLAGLANLVDEMQFAVNDSQTSETGEVSDSLEDWQKNLEKSADSFLSHFIRISDKNSLTNDKAFIAPNQEVYLRENIRLRLQIAMMAVPRQQNDLYKQSLDAVASWVRSYFDADNANVKRFLSEVDELAEQSIYVDAPIRLQSLDLLSQQLNRSLKPITKIQLEEEKSLPPVNNGEAGNTETRTEQSSAQ